MSHYIGCSIFSNVVSETGGVILNASNINFSFVNCDFRNISSKKTPGCIYAISCTIEMSKCSFSFCTATGNNDNFGRIFFLIDSFVSIKHFSANRCGEFSTDSGDSLTVFKTSFYRIDFYNSSLCYGKSGSASLCTISAVEEISIRHLNCIDCIDFASYELWSGEKTITTYHSNFINSSNNTGHCLNIHCPGDFFYCAFAKTASSFCANSKEVKFTNCMIDKSQSIGTFTIDISPCFNFNVQKPLKCNILTHKRCRKNNTPFIYIFMINLCTK